MDIKDFILIGGGLLIASVVAHGFWIAWRDRRQELRIDIKPDLIPDELDDIVAKAQASLAERPAFATAMRRCADPRDAFRLHIDLATVMHKYSHLLPAEAKTAIRGLGVNRIRSFTTAVGLRDENVTVATLIDSPGAMLASEVVNMLGRSCSTREARRPACLACW